MKASATLIISGGLLLLSPSNNVVAKEPPPYINAITANSDAGGGSEEKQLSIFSNKVSFELPVGWKMAFNSEKGNMYKAEFVPAGESLNDWSALFCIQGFEGLATDIDSTQFLNRFADTYKDSCQGSVTYEQLGTTQIGGKEAVHGIIGCTNMKNMYGGATARTRQGEIGYYAVLKDTEDLYLLHKSMRGEVFNESNPPLNGSNHRDFISKMLQLKFQR
ncbi:hypothetical protein Q4601_11855 [Shewanella sp. 1_MG-2023]|uniref:Secreted protein n=1 Tax=Shewanella electrodiphila TaxID=934143 RepID=A0ABT0KL26_9GAMM|nr:MULTISPECIES: hypothetical protein [Shewanella]MCC4832796.1 hypothetical protein [Shewanella sp. 10N.7]MCL1044438.1 hypothetical protein [Shewanella electrodiphila]MDO6610494.1 hypothetical protein [Shewanella sp. 7_MG-2023]MDO6770619.1 hypothetical protein [Shewanella sp. 2_MG-2023]MDO6795005.1 hypothetical protein [Shewanella sp. 1_MG-2023]